MNAATPLGAWGRSVFSIGHADPFGRSASVMPWDRHAKTWVLDDSRAYDVGLSDDAGGGNPLGFAIKVAYAPTQHHVTRLDDYVKWTLYGVKPDTAKPPLKSLQIRQVLSGTCFQTSCESCAFPSCVSVCGVIVVNSVAGPALLPPGRKTAYPTCLDPCAGTRMAYDAQCTTTAATQPTTKVGPATSTTTTRKRTRSGRLALKGGPTGR